MKYLITFFVYVATVMPQYVFAQDSSGLVTCKEGGNCDYCDFIDMVWKINLWLVGIAGLIAVILIAYAGYRITSARGDVSIVTEARKLISSIAIGIFIMILASTLVDTLMKTATGGDFGVWNKPPDCGISKTVAGADKVQSESHTTTVVAPKNTSGTGSGSGYVNNGGFIDAPPPNVPESGSNGGFVNANDFIDAPYPGSDTGTGFVNDGGFIDAPYPTGYAPPPQEDYDNPGPM